jgi:hypothetical protein
MDLMLRHKQFCCGCEEMIAMQYLKQSIPQSSLNRVNVAGTDDLHPITFAQLATVAASYFLILTLHK